MEWLIGEWAVVGLVAVIAAFIGHWLTNRYNDKAEVAEKNRHDEVMANHKEVMANHKEAMAAQADNHKQAMAALNALIRNTARPPAPGAAE